MLFLAKAIMKSPNQALLWSFVLGAATLVLSPVGVLSGAAIALVTLAAGFSAGVRVLAVALLGGLVSSVMMGSVHAVMFSAAEFWLPGFLFAVVLGKSRSLSNLVQAISYATLVGLMAVYLLLDSPQASWAAFMQQLVASWQADGVELDAEATSMLLERMPSMLTMLVFMGLYMVWVSMLFIGRWWQTQLYGMPAFGAEFRALTLGAQLSVMLGVLFLAVLVLSEQMMLQDMLGLLTLAFMLQGLAVLHQWVFVKKTGKGWLVLIYVLLGVLPQMIVMVASLGWLENWLHWRDKLASDSNSE